MIAVWETGLRRFVRGRRSVVNVGGNDATAGEIGDAEERENGCDQVWGRAADRSGANAPGCTVLRWHLNAQGAVSGGGAVGGA